MKVVLRAKTGIFLGVSSVLVAWTLLAVRPALAQVRVPSCPSPSDIRDSDLVEITSSETEKTLNGASTADNPVQSFMIRVPPLASGELTVETQDSGITATVGRLCRGSKSIATYEPDQPAHLMLMEPVSTGDYFLAVEGAGTNPRGNYTVNVTFSGVLPQDGNQDGNIDDTGSLRRNNQRDSYPITINDSGLLTVATRGRLNTKGVLYRGESTNPTEKIAEDEDSGSGGNFQIVTPVMGDPTNYVVYVEGQTGTERGDYTVVVDFKNASLVTPADNGDGAMDSADLEERGDADYFFITPGSNAFMTVETHKEPNTASRETNTKGTLFGPNGQLAADSDAGDGTNFQITVPVLTGEDQHYVVKVEGERVTTTGEYRLEVSYQDVMGEVVEVPSQSQQDIQDIEMTLTAPTGNEPVQVDRYVLNVSEPGTLQVSTTGTTDTFGTLIGPDGRQLAEDDNSGADKNFLMTRHVTKGLHGVTVQGAQRADAGQYRLVISFIKNSTVTPPPPDSTPDTTPPADDHGDTSANATPVGLSSSTPGELETETDADYFQLAVTRTGTLTVETTGATDTQGQLLRDGVPVADDDDSKDGKNFRIVQDVSPGTYYVRVTGYHGARGSYTLAVRFNTAAGELENPPNGASRSGIGVVSGWVCQADTVEIEFVRGNSTYRVPVAYGTSRDDTRSRCGDDGKNGFGLTWNWNLLPAEGRWTVRALADGTEFDSASVDVVHLTNQEFAEGLVGECRVPDFPRAGQTTLLEWEESSQNFQIVDTE